MGDSLDHMASGRTRIEWTSSLNTEYKPHRNYRRTSIIGTIGKFMSLLLPITGNIRALTDGIGPKTNSAAKINVLRKGTIRCHGLLDFLMLTTFQPVSMSFA